VRTGAVENGNRPEQIAVVTSLAPVAARLAEFRGAVFLKGSRRYQLEQVLPARQQESVHA
jgi:UDP-N-acetylmuramoyl-tripeptide--D-alanyl-D-alanine ligase